MKNCFLLLIRMYQKTVSLDHGILGHILGERLCRFYPTCSQYTYEAVDRFGVVRGLWMGIRRVSRCHPWNPGGVDLVPKRVRKNK